MRSKSTLLLLSLSVLCATAVITRGEIAPRSPEELAKAKTIVVGKINSTYRETTRSKEWENTRGVVEIEVESVERGENVKPGDIIFARFWNRYWIANDNPPPSGSGHHLHDNGTKIRAHLEPGKGAYEILLPNGLVVIEKAKSEAAPAAAPAPGSAR
jgi:hypothetical protein